MSRPEGSALEPNPFLGPRSFEQSDDYRFFGRDRETRDLRSLWLANRLVVVFGYSGVGKSSLLQAGILPTLPSDVDLLPVGRLTPIPSHTYPSGPDADGGNPFTFALLSGWWPGAGVDDLRGLTLTDFFERREKRRDEYGEPVPILAIVDQFEKLFTSAPHHWQHRDTFLDDLANSVSRTPELRLLLSIRQDALAAFLPYEHRMASPRRRFQLNALTPGAALEAVAGPLRTTSRTLAPGVAEAIVEDLRTARLVDGAGGVVHVREELVEPVQLQILCARLWDSLPEDVQAITAEHVEQHGDVDQTLAEFYGRVVVETATAHGIDENDLRAWIEKTFITEMATRSTAYEGAARTAGMVNAVARTLSERHLLKAEHRLGARWYELQHDRLVEPILRTNRSADHDIGTRVEPDVGERTLTTAEDAFAAGQFEAAGSWARRAISTATQRGDRRTEAEALFLLGRTNRQFGDHAAAEEQFDRAAEMFEVLGDRTAVGLVLCALGELFLAQGRLDRALHEFQEAAPRLPSDPSALDGLARTLWSMGNPQAALGVYEQILATMPASVAALGSRGQLMAELGRHQEALADLRRCLRATPDPAAIPALRSATALALAHRGDFDAARLELAPALEAGPVDARVLIRAAKVEVLAGDPERARAHLAAVGRSTEDLTPYQAKLVATMDGELSAETEEDPS